MSLCRQQKEAGGAVMGHRVRGATAEEGRGLMGLGLAVHLEGLQIS